MEPLQLTSGASRMHLRHGVEQKDYFRLGQAARQLLG
jgi:hypothetical protein